MLTAILIENDASRQTSSELLKTLEVVSKLKGEALEVIYIGENAPDMPGLSLESGRTLISSNQASLSYCYRLAVQNSKGRMILFLDARAEYAPEQLREVIRFVQSATSNSFVAIPTEMGGEVVDLPEPDMESLIGDISSCARWPVLCFAASREFMDRQGVIEGKSSAEIAVRAYLTAVSSGETIGEFGNLLYVNSRDQAGDSLLKICELTNLEKARCLNQVVSNCNIEDLFPNHPWKAHGQESAAACYHTLAAIFIRLGDNASAMECLALGDRFEDSPRSLALKALISLSKGETLGAVANMVSSLQQYEVRKKEQSQTRYLTFSPKNLEVINLNLQAGLDALNQRNNEGAIQYFAEAVFSFDDFYRNHGIDSIKGYQQ